MLEVKELNQIRLEFEKTTTISPGHGNWHPKEGRYDAFTYTQSKWQVYLNGRNQGINEIIALLDGTESIEFLKKLEELKHLP